MSLSEMTSLTAPSTPFPAVTPCVSKRRSFTLPVKKSVSLEGSPRVSDTSLVETLFYHRSGKVVSFTVPASIIKPTFNLGRDIRDTSNEIIGTLPWATSTERTLAAGAKTQMTFHRPDSY